MRPGEAAESDALCFVSDAGLSEASDFESGISLGSRAAAAAKGE